MQNQLLISKDIEYISQEEFNRLAEKTVELSKITNGLIKKSKEIVNNLNF